MTKFYVTRDRNRSLTLWQCRGCSPEKFEGSDFWWVDTSRCSLCDYDEMILPPEMFPEVSWIDREPREIEIASVKSLGYVRTA
jgi:hypothetical protein